MTIKKRQAGRHTDKQTGRQEKERNRQKVKSMKQFLRGIIYVCIIIDNISSGKKGLLKTYIILNYHI